MLSQASYQSIQILRKMNKCIQIAVGSTENSWLSFSGKKTKQKTKQKTAKQPQQKWYLKEVGARTGYKREIPKHCPGMLGWFWKRKSWARLEILGISRATRRVCVASMLAAKEWTSIQLNLYTCTQLVYKLYSQVYNLSLLMSGESDLVTVDADKVEVL